MRKNWYVAAGGLLVASLLPIAQADDIFWDAACNAGINNFSNTGCWAGGVTPNGNDVARFDLASAGYTVTFDGAFTNQAASVDTDVVTWDLNANTYTLTNPANSLLVGGAGDTGMLTLSNGTLSTPEVVVGNGGGTGLLTVSGSGIVSTTDLDVGKTAGSTGHITVSGSGSQWNNASTMFVGVIGTGTLTIEDGGVLISAAFASLGALPDSTGTATITGDGSQWNSSSDLDVGTNGDGTLNIEAGGAVSNVNGLVGFGPTGTGVATVTGTDSQWTNTASLFVGNNANGTLDVEAGGGVSSVTGYVGWGVASISEATVTGTDSQWTNSEDLYVGRSGGGTLNVEASGEVLNRVGFVGFNPGSIGDVTVTGAGSTWTATDSIYLGGGASGAGGFGSLSVETGGTVDVTNTLKLWGGGTLTLDGGTVRTESLDVSLGTFNFFSGTLHLIDDLFINDSGPLGETVAVQNNQTLTIDGFVVIDRGGTLTIEAGGVVSNARGFVSTAPDLTGAVTVTGTGAEWDNSSTLYVGAQGSGVLEVTDGGIVTSAAGRVGGDFPIGSSPGTGTVIVNGEDSQWNISGDLFIGESGDGTLHIEAGGLVSNVDAYLGNETGFGIASVVTVVGADSRWNNTGNLTIGRFNTGTLSVADGGAVSSDIGRISGGGFGSASNATVTGVGSMWQTDLLFVGGSELAAGGLGVLTVGPGGTVDVTSTLKLWDFGTLVLNGGTVRTHTLDISLGTFDFNSGTLIFSDTFTVSGAGQLGSVVDLVAGQKIVSDTLTTVEAGAVLSLNGGTLSTETLDIGSGTFDFNAGTLNFTGNLAIGASSPLGAAVNYLPAQTLDVDGMMTIESGSSFNTSGALFAVDVVNSGSASHIGGNAVIDDGGTVTNNANAQLSIISTGAAAVEYGEDIGTAVAGTPNVQLDNYGDLLLNNVELIADVDAFAGSSLTVIRQATIWGTLSGETDIFGPGTTSVLGGLNPGFSAASMFIESNLDLGEDAVALMELGGLAPDSEHDQVTVGGTLTLGGLLEVALLDDYAPEPGDGFTLFEADALLGSFDALLLPELAPGYRWLAEQSATAFSLAVASAVPLPPGIVLLLSALGLLGMRRRSAGAAAP